MAGASVTDSVGDGGRHVYILEDILEYTRIIIESQTDDQELDDNLGDYLIDKLEVYLDSYDSLDALQMKETLTDLIGHIEEFYNSQLDSQESVSKILTLFNRKKMDFRRIVNTLGESPNKVFHLFSPHAQKSSFLCSYCDRKYDSFRGLKQHHKDNHNDQNFQSAKQDMKGTCMLPSIKDPSIICGKKFTTDQINRHFKSHKIDIPKGKFLRGFEQNDDQTFSALFLQPDDPNPDYFEVIQQEDQVHDIEDDVGGDGILEPIEERPFGGDDGDRDGVNEQQHDVGDIVGIDAVVLGEDRQPDDDVNREENNNLEGSDIQLSEPGIVVDRSFQAGVEVERDIGSFVNENALEIQKDGTTKENVNEEAQGARDLSERVDQNLEDFSVNNNDDTDDHSDSGDTEAINQSQRDDNMNFVKDQANILYDEFVTVEQGYLPQNTEHVYFEEDMIVEEVVSSESPSNIVPDQAMLPDFFDVLEMEHNFNKDDLFIISDEIDQNPAPATEGQENNVLIAAPEVQSSDEIIDESLAAAEVQKSDEIIDQSLAAAEVQRSDTIIDQNLSAEVHNPDGMFDQSLRAEAEKPEDNDQTQSHEENIDQSTMESLSPEKSKSPKIVKRAGKQKASVTLVSDNNVELVTSIDMGQYEEDSDFELEDSVQFTLNRQQRKDIRHRARTVCHEDKPIDRPENDEIAQMWEDYMKKKNIKTKNKDPSTIDKYRGHLFTYKDSMLTYEIAQDQSFNLKRMISFSSENYLAVKSPLDWIQETAAGDSSRSKEKLKAHASWRQFLRSKLSAHDFGGTAEALLKSGLISSSIDRVDKLISDMRLFPQYNSEINREAVEVATAKALLQPSNAFDETESVKKWNTSQEAKDENEKFNKMYKIALEKKTMGAKQFSSFGHFVKFNLIKSDKQRTSAYNFQNHHFWEKTKLYLPPNYSSFNDLPENWDPNIQPTPDTQPSVWQMRLSGGESGLKGQVATVVNITPPVMEWMERYREIKLILGIPEEADSYFFVTSKNQKLPANFESSIWKKFEATTGVPSANPTLFRRAAESTIQDNEKMRSQVLNLNKHSAEVGQAHYHKTGNISNAEFVNLNSVAENESSAIGGNQPVDEDVAEQRKKRSEEDEMRSKKKAEEFLSQRKNKNVKLSKRCRVLPVDRVFLQQLMTSEKFSSKFTFSKKFPKDPQWKVQFYRWFDGSSFTDGDWERLKKIERLLFENICKEVEEETKEEWQGSKEQNRLADLKIAQSIKSSFRSYENTKKPDQKKFFKF